MYKRTIILMSSILAACVAVIALLCLPALSEAEGVGGGLSVSAAPAAELHVCATCAYHTVQAAVDAAGSGDVIKVAQGTYTDIHVRTGITQVVYISKTVTVRGGYNAGFTTWDPTAQHTTLDANGAGRGVTIIGSGIAPTLIGLRITGGQAGEALWDRGGGIYVDGADGVISDCLIYSNTVSYYGGGVYISSSSAELTGNTIVSNTVTAPGSGAGVYISSGSPVLERNVIRGNKTSFGAGGVSCHSSARLTGNSIIGNEGREGGGIELLGDAEVTGNLIQGNTASYGGGVYIWGSNPTLVNNAVVDNRGTYRGAGIYVTTGSPSAAAPRLLHNTIARNSGGAYGDGSAVYVQDEGYYHCAVALTNTIIFSHTVGVTVTAGNTATLNGTLWQANGTDRGGAGSITHSNDHSGDPAFKSDGYHLTPASAAIDKGVNAGVTTDIDGEARPIGTAYDIGADEMAAQYFVYLPLVLR